MDQTSVHADIEKKATWDQMEKNLLIIENERGLTHRPKNSSRGPEREERVDASSPAIALHHLSDQHYLEQDYARLEAESERRARKLALLNKAGQAMTSTLDLNSVLEQMIVEVNALLAAGGASVLLHDPAGDDLVFAAVALTEAKMLIGTRIPMNDSIAGWAMRKKQPVLVQDAQHDPRFFEGVDTLTGMTTQSLVAIPLIYKERAIGVVEVVNNAKQVFDRHDLEMLETLAGSAAIAIENARLYDQVEHHAQQLAVLHELDRAITISLRIDDVYHAFSLHAARLLAYDYMSISLRQDADLCVAYLVEQGEKTFPQDMVIPLNNSVAGWVMARGQPMVRHSIGTNPRFVEDEQLALIGIQSVMIIPLRSKGKIMGIWSLGNQAVGAYHPDDLEIAQAMADLLAIAIENAELFEQVQTGREQMRWLAQQAVSAHEEERQRLSYELHDEAGQNLIALKLLLQLVQDELPAEAEALRRRMSEAVEMTDTTMEQLRSLARDLRPPALTVAGGLNDTFEELCRDFAKRTSLSISYVGQDVTDLSESIITCLYRFLQETLTNVAKHARAKQVQAKLEVQNGTVSLTVQDDGLGFDKTVQLANSRQIKGIGLLGIQERLELLGGWLKVESQLGQGACLTAFLPMGEQ